MPKPVTPAVPSPVRTAADRDRSLMGMQGSFLEGFSALSELAPRCIPMPKGRVVSPAETVNVIVGVACSAVSTVESARGMVETDEDFSPLENQLAEIMLSVMAASSTHRLRVAQCVAAKLATKVSI